MDSIIRIEFTPTFQQYLQFTQSTARYPFRRLRPFAYISLFCFAMSPLIDERNQTVLQAYGTFSKALFLPGLLFVFLPASVYFTSRKRWRISSELREPKVYEFSDAGMSVTGTSFHGVQSWTSLVSAQTNGSMIFLVNGQRAAHLIPADAFGNTPQLEAFKTLLRAKVPDCKRLQ
jgi:hypothetical protein